MRGVVSHEGMRDESRAPGAAALLGKVLNAFLLDHIDADIELLTRVNKVIADGTKAYGDSFLDTLNVESRRRGAQDYRYVNCLSVRPSEDIGRLASEHLKKGRLRGDPMITKRLFSVLDLGVRNNEADLASYLLFDGPFCRQLIEMGRADAHARRDSLLEFFGAAEEDGGGEDILDDSGDRASASMPVPYGT